MNYGELKSNVESALARSDVPNYVYTLMMADINRDIRIVEMEATDTLTFPDAGGTGGATDTLPDDFLQIISLYIDGSDRTPLTPMTDQSLSTRHDSSGRPAYYSITKTSLNLMPEPDGEYDLALLYYAKLDDFSSNSDENDVMDAHPALFLYSALHHAAVWAQDIELASRYGEAFVAQKALVRKANARRRNSGPMVTRNRVKY